MNSTGENRPREGLLPVTLVTGFLGAGKTTLLRQLILAPHGLRIGLILNEFGQAGIDVPLATDQAYLELAEGCACCLRNPDLVSALVELGERKDIDRVIIETSGLADPLPLIWTLQRPDLAHLVRLDAVIVVVDPENALKTQTEEWLSQVRSADVVVLSKRDIAGSEAIEAARKAVREVNAHARFVEPGEGLPVEILLDLEPAQVRELSTETRGKHSEFRGVTFAGPERWDLDRLEDLLEELPAQIFRVKGIVPTLEGSWASFHVVGGRLQIDADAPAPEHGEGRLAVFGPRLEEAEVRGMFQACLAEEG